MIYIKYKKKLILMACIFISYQKYCGVCQDKIHNKVKRDYTSVSSGSLAEGLDLPGSDVDIMLVFNCVTVIQDVQHINRSSIYTTLFMEEDMEFPGFSRLKFIADGDIQCVMTSPECFVETTNGFFLSI
jgi:hypothetical protein